MMRYDGDCLVPSLVPSLDPIFFLSLCERTLRLVQTDRAMMGNRVVSVGDTINDSREGGTEGGEGSGESGD